MDPILFGIGIAAIVLILIVTTINSRREAKIRLMNSLKNSYGEVPQREYSFEEFSNISRYFEKGKGRRFYIDDITWNDLDMDRVFKLINNTRSSAGEEYLYRMLREPEFDVEKLKEFDSLVEFMDANEEDRLALQKIFCGIGRSKKLSLADFLDNFLNLEKRSTLWEWLNLVRFFAAIVVFAFDPAIGILAIIAVIIYNVLKYFNLKSEIGSYFICTSYIAKIIYASGIIGKRSDEALKVYEERLSELSEPLHRIVRKTNSIGNGSGVSDGPLEAIIEYKNMVFHTDIISFYQVLDMVKEHIDDIRELIDCIGRLESAVAVASFRRLLPVYSKPEFTVNAGKKLNCVSLYHPLIEEPVANSIDTDSNVLLTGSNASGKSTFLKTVALNTLLSQSVFTSCSVKCEMGFYRLYSSMSLKDDLEGGDSYYMVEIKSLKRIMDAQKEDGAPVMCFVDEVLRGTNTVERIAASGKILECLDGDGAFVFAATHDIELTHMLENIYANYHFREEVLDDDVKFNYILNEGRATTRNAIKLLKIMGYDEKVIDEANRCAEVFNESGEWRL
ncbi:MAG: hypothetical protein K6F92_07590 [Lachnospiraceae bacterium]|nr:hypothetical protein [Lachnospiraceae bacterium]